MPAIANSAVIALCIVGAGIALLIGWAIGHRLWNADDNREREGHQIESGGFSQYEYQRDLRERNKENIAAAHWNPKRPRQQSIPLSTTDLSGQSYSHY